MSVLSQTKITLNLTGNYYCSEEFTMKMTGRYTAKE
jgi:hypothetical protein